MKYSVSVLLGAISYGILSTIVVKAYDHGYSLGEVVGSQLLTGCLLAWALVGALRLMKRRRSNRHVRGETAVPAETRGLTWKQRVTLLLAGMPTAITGLLYYESLRTISNSLAILLLFQFTWMGVVIQAIHTRKRPSGTTLLTLAVLFGGTLLAAGITEGAGHLNGKGVVYGLLSAASYTIFIIVSGKAVPHAKATTRSAWMITGGLLLVFVLFPPHFLTDGTIVGPLLLFGALLGFFGAFLPPLLFTYGVPHIGGGMAGILGAAELPVAVSLSAIVLGEDVSAIRWLGIALVLAGVAIPEAAKSSRKSTPRYDPRSVSAS
ncbi:EamA family transporter [Cohnella panacarvi]|uniref:EamA family transporter n=1 Tax=Cohnella panacarvi TaxID=400776 RepID=UPI00047CE8B6|nr:DMT family transporter [Cohnella panacarvi]